MTWLQHISTDGSSVTKPGELSTQAGIDAYTAMRGSEPIWESESEDESFQDQKCISWNSLCKSRKRLFKHRPHFIMSGKGLAITFHPQGYHVVSMSQVFPSKKPIHCRKFKKHDIIRTKSQPYLVSLRFDVAKAMPSLAKWLFQNRSKLDRPPRLRGFLYRLAPS